MQDFKELRGESDSKNYHKQEVMAEIASNKEDREVLWSKIEIYILPLKRKSYYFKNLLSYNFAPVPTT